MQRVLQYSGVAAIRNAIRTRHCRSLSVLSCMILTTDAGELEPFGACLWEIRPSRSRSSLHFKPRHEVVLVLLKKEQVLVGAFTIFFLAGVSSLDL